METPPDQTPPARPIPLPPTTPPEKKGSLLPTGCLPTIFAGFVLVVLAGLLMPCFGCVGVKGSQTKALAQAKQIGLALKLFAEDHDGNYPRQGVPAEMVVSPKNANQAFACLFPTYSQSETLFGNKLSAYQTHRGPDNRIDNPFVWPPVETLRPGENVYGYMLSLTENSNPATPLVFDGTDGTGTYTTDRGARGGVWGGTKAVVIRLDNSGGLETLVGGNHARFIPEPGAPTQNLLTSPGWGKEARILDPAIHP